MAEAIWGNDCDFKVNINGEMTPLVCAKSWKINIATDTVETTTYGNGYHKSFRPTAISTTISFDGVMKLRDPADNSNTAHDAVFAQLQAINFNFEMWFEDPVGNLLIAYGEAVLTNTGLEAAYNSFAGFTMEMIVSGELKFRTVACDANIGEVHGHRLGTPGLWRINLTNIAKETRYIKYTINDGPEVFLDTFVSLNTSFSFDITIASGDYSTLKVFPLCSVTGESDYIKVSTINPAALTF